MLWASRNLLEEPLATISTRVYGGKGWFGLRTQLSEPCLFEGPRAVHSPSICFLIWRDLE